MRYLLLFFLTGCTSTTITVTSTGWTMKRTSFLQKVEIPKIKVATNGVLTVEGYKSDGGNEAAAAIAAAAVSAAMKSVVP